MLDGFYIGFDFVLKGVVFKIWVRGIVWYRYYFYRMQWYVQMMYIYVYVGFIVNL